MGNHVAKPSNKSMVDRLVEQHSFIQSPSVEGVFRAVDRAMYFDLGENDPRDPYDDDPWRRGNLHLSAPCIYAKVVEALELKPGLSFLNLGSGTGYLNTIIGLLVGPHGVNHGIEFHPDVVDYANKRLQQFKLESRAIDKYHFSEPFFVHGNCINLNPNSRYDRIYLGAACLPELEDFMKKLIKPDGGILVMPYENHLVRYRRSSETQWLSEKLMDVNFTLMIRQNDKESIINMPLAQAKTLKELCRISIRQHLRDKIDSINPNLRHSDNIHARRLRKAKAERAIRAKEAHKERLRCSSKQSKSSRERHMDCDCSCRQRCSTTNTDCRSPKVEESANQGSSSLSDGRVVTRSASRRMENHVPKTTIDKSTPQGRFKQSSCRHQYPIDSAQTDNNPSSNLSRPESSTSNDRVITRSASRRLEAVSHKQDSESTLNPARDIDNNEHHVLRGATRGDIETSSAGSSGNEDEPDEDNDDSNCRPSGACRNSSNCARTRPYVCSVRSSQASLPSPLEDQVIGQPNLRPFQRRIARIIDSSSSSSSSSSDSSSSLESFDLRGCIGRQVILEWPSFVRHSLHAEESDFSLQDSEDSLSDDFSGSNLSDLILDGNISEVSSAASWDSFFESINNAETQSDQFSISSSQFQTPTGFTDDEELVEADPTTSDSVLTQSHGTGSSSFGCVQSDRNASDSGDANQSCKTNPNLKQTVARRLRSSKKAMVKAPPTTDSMQPSTSAAAVAATAQEIDAPQDRPVPSCSRRDQLGKTLGSLNESEDAIVSNEECVHLSSGRASQQKQHQLKFKNDASNRRLPTHSSSSNHQRSECLRHSNRHSSSRIRSPVTSNQDNLANARQQRRHRSIGGLSSSRRSGMSTVLLTAGLGATLSIASRQFVPAAAAAAAAAAATTWNGSFRLFERRLINNSNSNSSTTAHRSGLTAAANQRTTHNLQTDQRTHKRKRRHSSSESSESSNNSATAATASASNRRQKNIRCCCCCRRRRNNCLQSPPSSGIKIKQQSQESCGQGTSRGICSNIIASSAIASDGSSSSGNITALNSTSSAIASDVKLETTTSLTAATGSAPQNAGLLKTLTVPAAEATLQSSDTNTIYNPSSSRRSCLESSSGTNSELAPLEQQQPSGCQDSVVGAVTVAPTPHPKSSSSSREKSTLLPETSVQSLRNSSSGSYHQHHHHHHHHQHCRHHHCDHHQHRSQNSSHSRCSTTTAEVKESRRRNKRYLIPATRTEMESSALRRERREERRQRRRQRRATAEQRPRENECERYHSHLSAYIEQLPLPRVLLGYLDYNRSSSL